MWGHSVLLSVTYTLQLLGTALVPAPAYSACKAGPVLKPWICGYCWAVTTELLEKLSFLSIAYLSNLQFS